MTLLEDLAARVDALHPERRALVAVDGPDAAGKTTLADRLAALVRRPVVRASLDHWHRPRAARLERGALSPEGYFLDSFDLGSLVVELLAPFRDGATVVRTAAFDVTSDAPQPVSVAVGPTATLVLDGVFLLREELRDWWDLSVYLHVPEEVTLARAVERDAELMGGEVRRRYQQRYLPGQALYRAVAHPLSRADVVVDNSDVSRPRLIRS